MNNMIERVNKKGRIDQRRIKWLAGAMAVSLALGWCGVASLQADDYPSNFSWQDGITNTRHNMTQRPIATRGNMTGVRNNYGEVCVYCHTPHGANENIAAPLWNRTFKNNTYETYDQLGTATLTANVNQPGVNSLTCLSCHDGTVAIDSIINMPGSGSSRYSVASKTSHQEGFLDNWVTILNATSVSANHYAMGMESPGKSLGCQSCHTGTDNPDPDDPGVFAGSGTDFAAFVIGTDLRNDHPVGVDFPTERAGVDFNDATATKPLMRFYDNDADGKADPNEIRYYKTGSTYRVECASCHDPHGVKGTGNAINASFLRIKNNNSAVCLTCHAI